MRRRLILLAGIVARMEDTRQLKCVVFGELMRGAGFVEEGARKSEGGISLGQPHSIWYQRRPMIYNNCSPGLGGVT